MQEYGRVSLWFTEQTGAQKRDIFVLFQAILHSVLAGAVALGPQHKWHLLKEAALLSLVCFKTDLWENRHNLPCDIFLLGTFPVNPHTSPQLRPGKGAQSGHRTHVPARWLLAQQLKPICFPSLVLSWFLMPELQDQPSCRRQLRSGCSQSLLLLLKEFRMYKKRATTT